MYKDYQPQLGSGMVYNGVKIETFHSFIVLSVRLGQITLTKICDTDVLLGVLVLENYLR